MRKYKKPLGLLLLCLCAVAVVAYVFIQADALPALEDTAELAAHWDFYPWFRRCLRFCLLF